MLLNEIIEKNIRRVLNETVSDKVYHFLSMDKLLKISRTDAFHLVPVFGGDFDTQRHRNRMFYACLSRTKSDRIGYGRDYNCRIELDGAKINHDFKSFPINYWCTPFTRGGETVYNGTKGSDPEAFEYEDRIVSNKSVIPDFHRYITRIDVLLPASEYDETWAALREIQSSLYGAMELIHVYDNSKDYNMQSGNECEYRPSANLEYKFNEMEDATDDEVAKVLATFCYYHYSAVWLKDDESLQHQPTGREVEAQYGGMIESQLKKYGLKYISAKVLLNMRGEFSYDDIKPYNLNSLAMRSTPTYQKAAQLMANVMRSNGLTDMETLRYLPNEIISKRINFR